MLSMVNGETNYVCLAFLVMHRAEGISVAEPFVMLMFTHAVDLR